MLAAIDVGSNTLRMLIGEVRNGAIEPFIYERRATRLAGGFDPEAGLRNAGMDRSLAALCDFADTIDGLDIDRVCVVGTEALRRATNRRLFVERVKQHSGLDLEIIDGEQEAALSSAGVFAALSPRPETCLIFDIGGGSTEFVLHTGKGRVFQKSYPLGVVDLCENHSSEAAQIRFIDDQIEKVVADLRTSQLLDWAQHDGTVLVGTAGTVTTLAALKLRMDPYDGLRVNNQALNAEELHGLRNLLAPMTIAQREQLPGLEKHRGDLILPGLRIVMAILACCRKTCLKVSDFGLLEGLLLQMAGHDDRDVCGMAQVNS